MAQDMTGQVALVTGASGSIGRSVVERLAAAGATVVTADHQAPDSRPVAPPAREVLVDLTDDAATASAVADLLPSGQLHHVVAVAGGGDLAELSTPDIAQESLDTFDRVVRNNLHVAFVTIRHTVPCLRATTGDRSITLVGSINADGGYGAPGYSSAKAGLVGLVRSLAPPLGADGIRINCLTLGTVDTDNLRALSAARGRALDLEAAGRRTALGRVLSPGDVARAVVAVATDLVGLTGADIVLDNGQLRMR